MILVIQCIFIYEVCFKYLGYFGLVHSIAEEKNYPLRILHNVRCMLGTLHLICHERGQVTLCCMSRRFKCPSDPKQNLGASHKLNNLVGLDLYEILNDAVFSTNYMLQV